MTVWVKLGDVWHVRTESSHTACSIVYDASHGPVFRRVDTWLPCDNVVLCSGCQMFNEAVLDVRETTAVSS